MAVSESTSLGHALSNSEMPTLRESVLARWHLVRSNSFAVVGFAIVTAVMVLAVVGPWVVPFGPYDLDLASTSLRPSTRHLLGTDQFGQDILSRIIYAAHTDIFIAVSAVGVSVVTGTLIGAVSGYIGQLPDEVIMRLMDILQSFPRFIFAMGIAYAVGPGIATVIVATSVLNIPAYARLMRAMILSAKQSQYATAARGSGFGHWTILVRHLIPNCMAPIFVQCTLHLGWAILEGAGLSFIGLGVEPGKAEWGVMVALGLQEFLQGHWWTYFFPGMAIGITVLGFNLVGDGMQEILDPRRRL